MTGENTLCQERRDIYKIILNVLNFVEYKMVQNNYFLVISLQKSCSIEHDFRLQFIFTINLLF
jgi:hypothetical protein